MLKHLRFAGSLLLTVVLIGGQPTTANPASADPPRKAAANERPAEPVPVDGPVIRVSGVVVTSTVKTVSGATVLLRAKESGFFSMGVAHNRELLGQTTTNAEGRFAFEKIPIPLRHERAIAGLLGNEGGAELLAWADGGGITWRDVQGLTNEPMRLVLSPEAKVEGVVRDGTGRPVSDVRIKMIGITSVKTLTNSTFHNRGDLRLGHFEGTLPDVASDAEGRFKLPHLPRDFRIILSFERPGWSRRSVLVDTGIDHQSAAIDKRMPDGDKILVQRSPLSVPLAQVRFATIKIVDASGQPVKDGAVRVTDVEGRFGGNEAVNSQGAVRITVTKPGRYRCAYVGDPLFPRLGASLRVDMAATGDIPVIEIRLPESRWLSGRVVDADTGKGIAGAYVNYFQKTVPESGRGSNAVSGANGEFRIPVASGAGDLRISEGVFGYFRPTRRPTSTQIDIPESGEPKQVTLTLGRGLVIRGKVHDRDGKPVVGAMVFGIQSASRKSTVTGASDGRFELSGFNPSLSTVLVVGHVGGSARMTVDAAPEHPRNQTRRQDVEIKLKPGITLTGRVLHQGQPRAGVVMRVIHSLGNDGRMSLQADLRTDASGSYQYFALEPGEKYRIEIVDADDMGDPVWRHLDEQTGATERSEVRLPDVQLITRRQTLRGVVVDRQGKPLAGIHVTARLASGASLSAESGRPSPWTESDDRGRFELTQLPDLPIELSAYKRNPPTDRTPPVSGGVPAMRGPTYAYVTALAIATQAIVPSGTGAPVWPHALVALKFTTRDTALALMRLGRRPPSSTMVIIRFPSRARPALNQQDIRIVLDPTLDEKIEDLDAPKKSDGAKK